MNLPVIEPTDDPYDDDPYVVLYQEGGTINGVPFNSMLDLLNMSYSDRKIDSSSAKRLTKEERKIKKWKKKRARKTKRRLSGKS